MSPMSKAQHYPGFTILVIVPARVSIVLWLFRRQWRGCGIPVARVSQACSAAGTSPVECHCQQSRQVGSGQQYRQVTVRSTVRPLSAVPSGRQVTVSSTVKSLSQQCRQAGSHEPVSMLPPWRRHTMGGQRASLKYRLNGGGRPSREH